MDSPPKQSQVWLLHIHINYKSKIYHTNRFALMLRLMEAHRLFFHPLPFLRKIVRTKFELQKSAVVVVSRTKKSRITNDPRYRDTEKSRKKKGYERILHARLPHSSQNDTTLRYPQNLRFTIYEPVLIYLSLSPFNSTIKKHLARGARDRMQRAK